MLFQLETPLDTVAAALKLARKEGARTISIPLPLKSSPPISWRRGYSHPNETEACILLGRKPSRVSVTEAPALARAVHALGPKAVILKLGEQGCFYFDGEANALARVFGGSERYNGGWRYFQRRSGHRLK